LAEVFSSLLKSAELKDAAALLPIRLAGNGSRPAASAAG
jgi:hypothetical protein